MDYYQEFKNNIDRLLKDTARVVMPGFVTAVSETTRTCTIKGGNVEYEDVRLYGVVKADLKGFCFIPKIGSFVLAGRIDGSNELFVIMFSEIDKVLLTIGDKTDFSADQEKVSYKNDKVSLFITDTKVELTADEIVFNGGELGGLVKIEELKKNLNSLKSFVEAMHAAVPTGISAVGAAMAANGALGKQAYDGAMAGKTIEIEDMENPKIKQ